MCSRVRWALAGLLTMASIAFAQESVPTATAKPHRAEIRLSDGSLVRVTILQDNLEVMTKYGKLTIPFADIRRIDFGLHRDVDRKQTADKHLPEPLRAKEGDIIHATEFPVIGQITTPTIKVHSTHFGDRALKLSELRTVYLRATLGARELTVDATKHGSAPDQWLDTGVSIDTSIRLVVTGAGQVDLWPQGPGQYLTTPKGYSSPGKGSTFMAGALVGRVGENGKAFLIGERYDAVLAEEGKLYLHIVPSPWNNVSTGSYRVHISADHAALMPR